VLAPLGVRYIAVVDRVAPGAHQIHALPSGLSSTLGAQIDLSLRQTEQGLTLYENAAWIPTRAVVHGTLPAGAQPTASALASNLSATPLPRHGSAGPGSLYLAEAHDRRWKATQRNVRLPDATPFGWANAYPLSAHAPVRLHFDGGPQRTLALLVQGLLWVALGALLLERHLRRVGRRRRAAAAELDTVLEPYGFAPSPLVEVMS
jgi:hypothetical protein